MKDFEPQLTRFHTSISEEPCMPDSSEFTAVADLFKLLGDSSRLKIFWILCHWEECVTSIRYGPSPPSIFTLVSLALRFFKSGQLIIPFATPIKYLTNNIKQNPINVTIKHES